MRKEIALNMIQNAIDNRTEQSNYYKNAIPEERYKIKIEHDILKFCNEIVKEIDND